MPATTAVTINLMGGDDFARTPMGRIITWATTYGRYIMILTEIIVLLAFISRFSLDRKLTDLKEEISQKQAIIEANISLEQEIRALQQNLKSIQSLLQAQSVPTDTLTQVTGALPPDVLLQSYDFTQKEIKLKITAGTTEGLSQFLGNLQANKQFENIELGDIKKQQLRGIELELRIRLKQTQKK